MSSIFISYSSKDEKVAERICAALEAKGLPCWVASRDINPGENFGESIVAAIRNAKVMLLVFTKNANNSDEIKKELVLAGHNRLTVVPVRVEDVEPGGAFAYELATRQWINLFNDWDREIGRLEAWMQKTLASSVSEQREPASSSQAKAESYAALALATDLARVPFSEPNVRLSESSQLLQGASAVLRPSGQAVMADSALLKAGAVDPISGSVQQDRLSAPQKRQPGTKIAAICVWLVCAGLVLVSLTVFGPTGTEAQACIRAGGSGGGCGGIHFPGQLFWVLAVFGAGYGTKLWLRK